MVSYLNLFASSIKGRFCDSVSSFHSAPSLLEISELCIFGFSTAIFRLWPRDQTWFWEEEFEVKNSSKTFMKIDEKLQKTLKN